MIPRATTTIRVLRGNTTDEWADDADTPTVVAFGVPASIIEQTRRNTTRSDDRPQTIRRYTGRLPAGTDVRDDDRIQDETTQTVYTIEELSQPANPGRTAEIRLELTRNT